MEAIQQDLISMGFLNYLCEVIIMQQNAENKYHYILGMIDFLDQADHDLQKSLYDYLVKDASN